MRTHPSEREEHRVLNELRAVGRPIRTDALAERVPWSAGKLSKIIDALHDRRVLYRVRVRGNGGRQLVFLPSTAPAAARSVLAAGRERHPAERGARG